jgi:hypothetical protein
VRVAEQERKLIWPELEERYPDLVLSLGTASSARLRRSESSRAPATRGVISYSSDLISLTKTFIHSSIQCNGIWEAYIKHLPKADSSARYIRINPELLDAVADIDDVDKMTPLQKEVESWLDNQPIVRQVAMQLIATCFYFELMESIGKGERGGYVAEGEHYF